MYKMEILTPGPASNRIASQCKTLHKLLLLVNRVNSAARATCQLLQLFGGLLQMSGQLGPIVDCYFVVGQTLECFDYVGAAQTQMLRICSSTDNFRFIMADVSVECYLFKI